MSEETPQDARKTASAAREVGVVLRRSKIDHAWIDHVWSAEAVLPDAPAAAPGTRLGVADDSAELFYAGPAILELWSAETGNYRDNLVDGRPQVWVALRTQTGGEMELAQVTADPTEGETLMEAGCDIVSNVPMHADIAAWVAAFVDEFHVERVFLKRKRDKAGPDPRKNPGARREPR